MRRSAYAIERERSAAGTRSWATDATSRAAMRANRRAHTAPERALRSELHRRGLRFRCDLPLDLDGVRVRPDVVFTRQRVAVFVDGCFWHGCPIHGTTPRANGDYWREKLASNRARDGRADAALTSAGWRAVRVWEHEDPLTAATRIEQTLSAP